MVKFIRTSIVLVLVVTSAGPAQLEGQADPFQVATFCTPYPIHTRAPVTVRNGS